MTHQVTQETGLTTTTSEGSKGHSDSHPESSDWTGLTHPFHVATLAFIVSLLLPAASFYVSANEQTHTVTHQPTQGKDVTTTTSEGSQGHADSDPQTSGWTRFTPLLRVDTFALIVSAFSLVASLYVFANQRALAVRSFMRTATEFHAQAVLELDKLYIERPELWAIYDDHPMAQRIEGNPCLEAQLEALCYYYLNVFDIAHALHAPAINRGNRYDEQVWLFVGSMDERLL